MTSTARSRAAGRGTTATVIALILLAATLTTAQVASAATPIASDCPAANCTSNDLGDTTPTVVAAVGGSTCASEGDSIDVRVTHSLDPNAQTRYDVGLYASIDPTTNLSCLADIIDSEHATGNFGDEDGDDICGDVTGTVTHEVVFEDVPCNDIDNDGFVDILICQTWGNNGEQVGAGGVCTQATVEEGTSAHCNCDFVTTEVPVGVPTMGKYAIGFLALLLISVGVLVVRKGNLI